mgnify:CR=1 FL=1
MAISKSPKHVVYMCSYCGTRQTRTINMGRPLPGTCTRRGKNMPHRWVISRKY